jgi:hypothetical protein
MYNIHIICASSAGKGRDIMEVGTTKTKTKRYNLVMPEELFDELELVADSRGTTVVDLLRRFVKLGLLAVKLEEKQDSALLIREGDTERVIVLL